MATTPGLLTDWPWKKLGSFKYVILAPWGLQSIYAAATKNDQERDYMNLLIIPFLLSRVLHNQIWITYSRHRGAKGNNRILDKTIEFDQVDRESNWDDHILLSGIMFYVLNITMTQGASLPAWRNDGVIITILLHIGPVEYLYYWLHRGLHHHFLYSRYHSHHHSSVVTEPISSVIHPFGEFFVYYLLFAVPIISTLLTGTASLVSLFGYTTYIDLMDNMGHCNFELVPRWIFSAFPPLKYLMYTPSFHSLHHTQFRTNYSLFMPFYDYIHGTMDKSTDSLYEKSLNRREDFADVVHLTHLTTPESIFHLQIGLASFASKPHEKPEYWQIISPLTYFSTILSFLYGRTFITEVNFLEKLKLQSWAIPKFTVQYSLKWQKKAIKSLIEESILQAEARGVKVLSLGHLNQGDELNRSIKSYIENHHNLSTNIVDGSSLAVAIVLNNIPTGTTEILFRGSLNKISCAVVSAMCHQGIQVSTFYEHERVNLSLLPKCKVILSKKYEQKIWVVGDDFTKDEQLKAPTGTLFIPFSPFPPKKLRMDCYYMHIPAMVAPPSLKNLNSCENWLPRRVISAWRVAGIVHALEEFNIHECGNDMFDVHVIWQAALKHGFCPTSLPNY